MRGNCNIEAAGIGKRVKQHRGVVVIQSDSAEMGRRLRKKEDVEKNLLKRKEGRKEGRKGLCHSLPLPARAELE